MMVNVRRQDGQSLVEFLLAVSAFTALLIAIPAISRIGLAQLKTGQAADYAAWRINKGVNVNNMSELSREVGQRFFSRTGADVLSNRNAECDDAAEQDVQGNSTVRWRSVKTQLVAVGEHYSDQLSVGNRVGGYRLGEGQYQVQVSVPVSNVTGVAGVPNSLIINKSILTMPGTWSAKSAADVQSRIKHSTPLKPYEKVQTKFVKVFNTLIANHVFPLEDRIDPNIVKPDVVPANRLATY